ncbi:hypothetical protein HU735_26405 [Pseudomonas sp. BW16M2]|uniref:hypothetical protein n=1 Tax=Pseudomonas sp. BW16M2 TaxID=2745489 RepID=UPI0016441D20|nr:hypothetical protein [Pseudomonas sp. BW16M2]MBC3438955.1 hypothetical protein [Pseudomonas sp. BW16M2]
MIISISDVWVASVEEHASFLEEVIAKGIAKFEGSYVESMVISFISANKDLIVYGRPPDLQQCIKNFFSFFNGELFRGCAIERMKRIFDYDAFSAKSSKPWTAYHLCSQARYKVCCYCQTVETGTCLPDEDTKGYRPPIDHYFGKAEYPFLALSLFNFIPCCEKCNGPQMKGEIDFSELPHLNPLIDEESIEFSLVPVPAAAAKLAEFSAFSLPREQYALELISTKNHNMSACSIKTFQLKSRYAAYSGRAYYLAKRLRGLPARQKFYEDGLDFDVELEDQLEFKPGEYKEVPYGKARLCLAKQFGVDLT